MTKAPIDESAADTAQPLLLQQSSPQVTAPELRKPHPDVVPVEQPVIIWRSLMLEQ